MRPVPPRSAAEICDFRKKRDPSLIHAPWIHVCDRLARRGSLNLPLPLPPPRQGRVAGPSRAPAL
eukprot:6164846-Pyramimonas_sp.AAC.1